MIRNSREALEEPSVFLRRNERETTGEITSLLILSPPMVSLGAHSRVDRPRSTAPELAVEQSLLEFEVVEAVRTGGSSKRKYDRTHWTLRTERGYRCSRSDSSRRDTHPPLSAMCRWQIVGLQLRLHSHRTLGRSQPLSSGSRVLGAGLPLDPGESVFDHGTTVNCMHTVRSLIDGVLVAASDHTANTWLADTA